MKEEEEKGPSTRWDLNPLSEVLASEACALLPCSNRCPTITEDVFSGGLVSFPNLVTASHEVVN